MIRKDNFVHKIPVKDLRSLLNGHVDVFICCGSYESRCRTIADALEPSSVGIAIISENVNFSSHVSDNCEYLRRRFAPRISDVKMDSTNPLATGDALRDSLQVAYKDTSQVYLIDITTFTHESLLILMRLLTIYLKKDDRAIFAYTSAAEYSVGATDENKWLTKGVADIRSVLGYPGEGIPSRPTHLIVLVGYEHERASRLIEAYEPNLISLGYGEPGTATNPKHQKSNEYFHRLVKTTASIYWRVDNFTFSCSDPWDTEIAIQKCVTSNPSYNVILAPMNTKISTVGAGLAALNCESIQLCYAQALQYNIKNYSTPGDSCHVFELKDLTEMKKY